MSHGSLSSWHHFNFTPCFFYRFFQDLWGYSLIYLVHQWKQLFCSYMISFFYYFFFFQIKVTDVPSFSFSVLLLQYSHVLGMRKKKTKNRWNCQIRDSKFCSSQWVKVKRWKYKKQLPLLLGEFTVKLGLKPRYVISNAFAPNLLNKTSLVIDRY